MFAYVIIGIELIILYIGFWIVFIREPAPREIRAELWGRYGDPSDEANSAKESIRVPSYLFINQEKLNSYLPSKVTIRPYRVARLRKRRHRAAAAVHSRARSCLGYDKSTGSNSSGWCGVAAEILHQEQFKRNVAEKFLLLLNRTLNKLSVKVQ